MAGRWMDEDQDREWRARETRGFERPFRDDDRRNDEGRSWETPAWADAAGYPSYDQRAERLRFSAQDYTGRTYRGYATRPESWRHPESDYRDRAWASDADSRYDDQRGEREGERPGDFLYRAGERIGAWLRGDHLMHGSRTEEPAGPRRLSTDFGREARAIPDANRRGLGPRGYRRSDERISDEVHDRLTEDAWLDASEIEVQVVSGEVTLSGKVDNRESKHRAERLIEDISGVGHVQNNLRVDPNHGVTGAGRGFGSSALEAEMRREAEARDPGNNGVSGLSGRTSSDDDLDV